MKRKEEKVNLSHSIDRQADRQNYRQVTVSLLPDAIWGVSGVENLYWNSVRNSAWRSIWRSLMFIENSLARQPSARPIFKHAKF